MVRCSWIGSLLLIASASSEAKVNLSSRSLIRPLVFDHRSKVPIICCSFVPSVGVRTKSLNRSYRQDNHPKLVANRSSLRESRSDLSSDDTEDDLELPRTFTTGDPRGIDTKTFGPLLPVAKAVDDVTGGWGLNYADLQPATPRSSVGQAFLATNFCYAAGGLALGVQGEWFLGALTEIAGIVSFWYHYSQLEFGKDRTEVRLALLIDYFTAGSALITGGVYMIQAGIDSVPLEAIVSGGGAVVCLTLCWVWEFGYPYIFWHSLWHILSAYTGYLVGHEHISNMT